MLDNINLLKAILNKELESKDLNHNKVLKLSRKLDKLILEYHNTNGYCELEKNEICK